MLDKVCNKKIYYKKKKIWKKSNGKSRKIQDLIDINSIVVQNQ